MIEFPPPINGTITQEWSEEHPAVDFACVTGRPVWAVTDGETTRYYNNRMGWVVVVRSPDGIITKLQPPPRGIPRRIRATGRHHRYLWQHRVLVNRTPPSLRVKQTLHFLNHVRRHRHSNHCSSRSHHHNRRVHTTRLLRWVGRVNRCCRT